MSEARIEEAVARLTRLYPRLIDLNLDRLRSLLARLGHPERRLPPVVHVAGTNGKGSTCAFLRAIGEAAGKRVHVYTSPHLVHFNERIRLAGALADDAVLADALEEVEQVNDGAPITVFEVITAVAFHLFAAVSADLCVLEVGLGGRGDATNVIDRPVACAITSISLDHRELLGEELAMIAAEKAGIIKPGIPVAIGRQEPEAEAVLLARAAGLDARAYLRGRDWDIVPSDGGLRFTDPAGTLDLPRPSLLGVHQHDNGGIAIAALRAARLDIADDAYARGLASASWPARLQRLHGRLTAPLPSGWELWLDGGHNPGAGIALAAQIDEWRDRPVDLVIGMKQAKDTASFLHPLLSRARSVWAVAEPGQHLALPVEAIVAASGGVARPGPRVSNALKAIPAQSSATRTHPYLRKPLPRRGGLEIGRK